MRTFVTRRSSLALPLVLFAALLLPMGVGAQPGVDPRWDHYEVYRVFPPVTDGRPIALDDQFIHSNHQVLTLDWFQNPTTKTIPGGLTYQINDPRLHYTWWRITEHPWDAIVVAINQFGDQTLRVGKPQYLLNPATKNDPLPTLPPRNHYKCYECTGQPVNRQVIVDDFKGGPWPALATFPRWFCNPVQKIEQATGQVFPIEDPNQHYVCYDLEPSDQSIHPALIRDQFIQNYNAELGPNRWLCVPTFKETVTSSRSGTWGKIKVLYR